MVRLGEAGDEPVEHTATYEMVLAPGVDESVYCTVTVFAGAGLAGKNVEPGLDVIVKPVRVEPDGQPE
jgi:hypothetical protein